MAIFLSPKSVIGWPDYVFIVFILAFCVALSFYFNRKRKNSSVGVDKLSEFLLAGRNLAILPATCSIAATIISPVSLTAITGDLYLYGIYYLVCYLGLSISMIFLAFLAVRMYRKKQRNTCSVFQLLEDRFDGCVRRSFSSVYIIHKLLHMAVVLYLPALSLTTLTHSNTHVTTLVLGVVCTLYSSVGGFRTVVWTDALQCILIMAALLMVIFQGVIKIGSWSDIWSLSVENGFLTSISWTESGTARSSVWAFVIMGPVLSIDYFLINQAVMQRILAVKSNSAAINSVIIAAILILLVGVTLGAAAGVLYILYGQCNPLSLKEYTGVKTVDQIFVYAIGDLFLDYPILKGVAISGIISASLSTFSSYINAFAALVLEDFLKPLFPSFTAKENVSVKICMVLSFLFGLLATFTSLIIPLIGNAVKVLSIINGLFRGPLSGIALLLMFYKKLTKAACLLSLVIVMTLIGWIAIGNSLYVKKNKYKTLGHSIDQCALDYWETNLNSSVKVTVEQKGSIFMPLYEISYFWYTTIGFTLACLLGIAFSEISVAFHGRKKYSQVQTKVPAENGGPESAQLT